MDEALFIWFYTERDRGLPISCPIIQQKALNLNAKLPDGDPDFTANQEHQKINGKTDIVCHLIVMSESFSSDKNTSKKFQKEFDKFIKTRKLLANQINNVNESGLFYRICCQIKL